MRPQNPTDPRAAASWPLMAPIRRPLSDLRRARLLLWARLWLERILSHPWIEFGLKDFTAMLFEFLPLEKCERMVMNILVIAATRRTQAPIYAPSGKPKRFLFAPPGFRLSKRKANLTRAAAAPAFRSVYGQRRKSIARLEALVALLKNTERALARIVKRLNDGLGIVRLIAIAPPADMHELMCAIDCAPAPICIDTS